MILDPFIRETVRSTLNALGETLLLSERGVDVEYIDRCIRDVLGFRTESESCCQMHFSRVLNVSFIWIVTAAHLAMAVGPKGGVPPLPRCRANGRRDPNLALSALLTQVTNHALSTVYLIQAGLDPSARVVLRALMEVSWIAVCVARDEALMAEYIRVDVENRDRLDSWSKHFRPVRLMQRLTCLEREAFADDDPPDTDSLREYYSQNRKDSYAFYSRYAHSDCTTVLSSGWAHPAEPDGGFEPRLLGNFSAGSKYTLDYLNDVLWYCVSLVLHTLNYYHRFAIPGDNECWCTTLALKCCAEASHLRGRAQDEGTDYIHTYQVKRQPT